MLCVHEIGWSIESNSNSWLNDCLRTTSFGYFHSTYDQLQSFDAITNDINQIDFMALWIKKKFHCKIIHGTVRAPCLIRSFRPK